MTNAANMNIDADLKIMFPSLRAGRRLATIVFATLIPILYLMTLKWCRAPGTAAELLKFVEGCFD
jgi:hypothetical protein